MKSRITLTATLAALSGPALAADAPVCSVCGDGTWPALEEPAPAQPLRGGGDEAAAIRRADPTWPEMTLALPAMQLTPGAVERLRIDPVEPVEADEARAHALVLGAPNTRVAKR